MSEPELDRLRTRALLILEFFRKKAPESVDVFNQVEQVVTQTFDRRDRRGLRMIFRDLKEWMEGLPPADLAELRSILGSHAGVVAQDEEAEIREIRMRGNISTEDEYRTVLGRVERIHADPSKSDEVDALNRLLSEFPSDRPQLAPPYTDV